MGRGYLIFFLLFAFVAPAHSSELGDAIRDRLRDLGKRTIEKVIDRAIKPKPVQLPTAIAGQCLVYTRKGKLDDDLACRESRFCQSGGRCFRNYHWPSGAKTVVEYRNKRPWKINGDRLKAGKFDGKSCLQNRRTKRIFCFVRSAVQPAPSIAPENSEVAEESVQKDEFEGAIPSDGLYHFVGDQTCGDHHQRLFLTLRVQRGDTVRARFASRSISRFGEIMRVRENRSRSTGPIFSRLQRMMVFGSERSRGRAIAKGEMAVDGSKFQGQWLEGARRPFGECGTFNLTKAKAPGSVYSELQNALKDGHSLPNAEKVAQLELRRPPFEMLAPVDQLRVPMSQSHRDLEREIVQYWNGFRRLYANRVPTGNLSNSFEREKAAKHVQQVSKVLYDAAGDYRGTAKFEETLYRQIADGIDAAGGIPAPPEFSSLDRACRRLLGRADKQRINETDYLFAFPIDYWEPVNVRILIERVNLCRAKNPSATNRLSQISQYLENLPHGAREKIERGRWMRNRSRAMLGKSPGLQTLIETNDFGLNSDDIKRRRIDGASYDRFFKDRLSRSRIDSIGATQSAITDFFKGQTFSSLSATDAPSACDRNFVAPLHNVGHRRWGKSSYDILKDQCSFNVMQYQERVIGEQADRVASTYLAAPATIDGLRANNWFSAKGVSLAGIPRQYQRSFLNRIEQKTSAHKKQAVSATLRTVRSAYRAAIPYRPTEHEFLSLCNNLQNSLNELKQECGQLLSAFYKRKDQVRCSNALKQFGGSEELLSERFASNFSRLNGVRISDVVCELPRFREDLSLSYSSGMLWQNPHLTVSTTDGETVLSVTLRRLKVDDYRSFGRYLFDIASGANEERPKGRYFIKELHGVGSKLPGSSAEQKLLCLYRLQKCT